MFSRETERKQQVERIAARAFAVSPRWLLLGEGPMNAEELAPIDAEFAELARLVRAANDRLDAMQALSAADAVLRAEGVLPPLRQDPDESAEDERTA